MPTMSRLIAAVYFAGLGYFIAVAFRGVMPEGTQFGQFNLLCLAIGMITGWRVMGRIVGKGYGRAPGSGVRTSITFVAWALLVCSIILMVRKAFGKRYGDSPLAAIVDVFALALQNGVRMFDPQVPEILGLILIGGALGGLLSEWAKRKWD